ncbi:unnamed protein product [Rotaria sp. Silwood1]|nr:unnamed protein product [Rotaria sp. Silwood1]
MTSNRKHSFIEPSSNENYLSDDDHRSNNERRWRRPSLAAYPWVRNDDVPDCYNRVRYIRDACKVLSDLWKTDKDFLNKSIDNDVARSYLQIHDFIDSKRKEWLEQLKKIIEQARDKQSTICRTMTEFRGNYEKAQQKLEAADANWKKFQTRSDRLTLPNFDERLRELEDIRCECEQARTLSRDIYAAETYKVASEEHSITIKLFYQYLYEENTFYNHVSKYLSSRMPEIEQRLENDELIPSFGYDLAKHCLKRNDTLIAYPIEICIRLLENSLNEQGLFRIAPSQGKQKK